MPNRGIRLTKAPENGRRVQLVLGPKLFAKCLDKATKMRIAVAAYIRLQLMSMHECFDKSKERK